MIKTHLKAIATLSFAFFLFSCSISRNQTPSRIGLVALKNYSLVNPNSVQDTAYMAIQNETDFSSTFTGAEKLDLYGKTAVAIILKNDASLKFDSADYIGSSVNVYAQTCSAASQPQCATGKVFLATIPKVGSAKTVHFFINNNKLGSIKL
ncbi:MAG: hypothetical protein EOO10_08000 [Chitinophagaceae bacterium]|nr:MAG: hypothetical protein EOO10_08000 [Chitinophagaceae bacterium]